MKTTKDFFYDGRLVLTQPSSGFRSSVDSLLLSHFACTGRGAANCVDLGAGAGIVGLTLLLAEHVTSISAVEVQWDLADLALLNASQNGFEAQYTVHKMDMRQFHDAIPRGSINLVVMNPPFWPLSHRLPSSEQRRVACHEVYGTIGDWMRCAAALISPRKGRISMVYPARRLNELMTSLSASRLHCSRLRLVHPSMNKPAELVLLEARPVSKDNLFILPPLILKTPDGSDSGELEAIVTGQFSEKIRTMPDNRQI